MKEAGEFEDPVFAIIIFLFTVILKWNHVTYEDIVFLERKNLTFYLHSFAQIFIQFLKISTRGT